MNSIIIRDLRGPGYELAIKLAAMNDQQRAEYLRDLRDPMTDLMRQRERGRLRLLAFIVLAAFFFLAGEVIR